MLRPFLEKALAKSFPGDFRESPPAPSKLYQAGRPAPPRARPVSKAVGKSAPRFTAWQIYVMIYLGTKFHEDRLRVMTVEKKITKPGSLTYKGRPLVRSGNTIYYGDMGDKYVAMLQILSEADFDGETLPTKVSVQIWSTDEELRPRDRVVKKTEKNNLFDAMNIASIWLERQLGEKKA